MRHASHPRVGCYAMEEEESLVVKDRVSTPSKESGYFEENLSGDLSDVIFSNYNHYGALLSVDTTGILIDNEARRSDHWEESRQGSSFSSGLVEDINDLDVNDSDEAKDDVTKEKVKRDVIEGSEAVVNVREGTEESANTHKDADVILDENSKMIIDSETPVCIHEEPKAVRKDKAIAYVHDSSEIIDCTEEDSNIECATSPSVITVEDWDDVEISDTGKTFLSMIKCRLMDPFVYAKSCVFSSLVRRLVIPR